MYLRRESVQRGEYEYGFDGRKFIEVWRIKFTIMINPKILKDLLLA